MARTTSVDILQRITQRVQETQRLCLDHFSVSTSSRSFPPQPCTPQQLVAHNPLPDPPSIQPALMAAGARPETSLAIEQAYQKRAADLRAAYHSAMMVVCSNQAQYPSKFRYVSEQKILSVFTELYNKQLVTWKEDCVILYLKRSSACNNAQASGGTPKFNNEYVPLLEYFFAENPFPTHADKAFLAKKSAMTYRQIHVWFQNRRNKMKKEGRVLRKKAVAEGATLPLDNLYQRMEKFIVSEAKKVPASPPSPRHSPTKSRDEMMSIADNRCNPLEPLAPLHAFPSSYRSCSYDPFPSKNGITNFGAPTWLRRPMTTAVRRPALDIDGLVDCFSRINILDDSGPRSRGSVDSFAAVAAITVIPFPAPLPALIRGTATHIAPIRVPLLAVPATASRRHVFNTPSPQSRPITLVPAPASEIPRGQKARRRKMAPLPKRIPCWNPIHQGATPAISEASVPSSSSSTSRSSSFGSESSSQSRLFSSANSTSCSSPGIMTPPPSFPSPPMQLASPAASLFSFSSNMTDLFGDALESIPSPAEGLQLDFNSSIFGNEHILKSPAFDFSFGVAPAANPVRAPS